MPEMTGHTCKECGDPQDGNPLVQKVAALPVCSQPNSEHEQERNPTRPGPTLSDRVRVRPGLGVLAPRTQCQQLTPVIVLF